MSLLEFIEFNRYNLDLILAGIAVYVAIIWAAVLLWVWRDISSRTRGIIAATGAVALVFFGNILGLLIYLLVRPEHTIEEKESHQLFHTSVVDKDITACAHCSTLVRVEYKFCPNCNHDLDQRCPDCKHRINPEWNYCINCSHRLYPETSQERLRHIVAASAWNVFNIPTTFVNGLGRIWQGYVRTIDSGMKGMEKAQSKVFGKKDKQNASKHIANKAETDQQKTEVKPEANYDLQAQINTLLKAQPATNTSPVATPAPVAHVAPKAPVSTANLQETARVEVVDESLDRVLTMFNFVDTAESVEV